MPVMQMINNLEFFLQVVQQSLRTIASVDIWFMKILILENIAKNCRWQPSTSENTPADLTEHSSDFDYLSVSSL